MGHRGVEASCCHPPPGARQENTFIPNCMSAPDCDPACCIHPANTLQLNVFDKEGNWYLIVLLRTIELVGHYCSSFFKAFFLGGGRGAKQLLCLAKVIARGFQFLFFFSLSPLLLEEKISSRITRKIMTEGTRFCKNW